MRLKLYRGVWCAVSREGGKTIRVSLRTKDRAEAERQFRDLERKIPGTTIGAIVPTYIADKRAQGAKSCPSMETAWKALAPTFANLRPDQVTRDLCRQYTAKRKAAGVSDGTVIKDLGVLKAALGWAKAAKEAEFEMPHAPPPRDRHLRRDEVVHLAESAESAHTALFIELAWGTAGRASAILELTWDRVDFERGRIRLSKGDGRQKGRATVPMTERLRKALEAAYEARTSDYVIEWGGKPVASIAKAFRRACERAGLEDVSPHVLRHSAAVAMVEAGVSIPEVGQYLGHTDLKVTYRVYGRYSPEHLKQAAAALE